MRKIKSLDEKVQLERQELNAQKELLKQKEVHLVSRSCWFIHRNVLFCLISLTARTSFSRKIKMPEGRSLSRG